MDCSGKEDCKYYNVDKCVHPYAKYCKYCDLWTPKWYEKCDEIEMKYDFKVGDKVITSTGVTGVIEDFCKCSCCKERGFYEPEVKTTFGTEKIYITDNDMRNNFSNFYKIGKYKFGNIDKDSVKHDIKFETQNIEESTKRLETYEKQLGLICLLEAIDD